MKWNYKYFTKRELECKCGCGGVPKKELVDKLEVFREFLGFPFIVTSGSRCSDYNRKVSDTGGNGPHVLGLAVDIRVYGERAYKIVSDAHVFGFTGIGMSQKGDMHKRFIHLDCVPVDHLGIPRPTIWSY